MTEPKQLFIQADSADSIYRRWQGWPDLQSEATNLRLPSVDQLQQSWLPELSRLAADGVGDLSAAVEVLRQAWLEHGFANWTEIAPSLLLHFLMLEVGSRLLRDHYQSETCAAVDGLPEGNHAAIWPWFMRLGQTVGISCVLGGQYQSGGKLTGLLASPDVSAALVSLNDDMTLLVPSPRILNRLGALGSANQTGSYPLAWSVLSAEELRQVSRELSLVTSGLSLLLRQSVYPLVAQQEKSFPDYLPFDLAWVALALLSQLVASHWQSAGLLPPITDASLGGL